MLNREFTVREKILRAICFVLAVGVFYYQFVYKGINQSIERFATGPLEEQLEEEQAKAAAIRKMEDAIARERGRTRGELTVYNNLAAEVAFIGGILDSRADSVSLTWKSPTLDGTTVRRLVDVSFRAGSYEEFTEILRAFRECPYRCLIGDINVSAVSRDKGRSAANAGLADTDSVSAAFSVTFFETVTGAESTEGLVTEKVSGPGEQGALEERAKAYQDS